MVNTQKTARCHEANTLAENVPFMTYTGELTMKEDNRKVRYTLNVLQKAYFELLREKPLYKITVTEICEAADIHRGTFYRYYKDIYDLQEKIEAELMEKFDKLITAIENEQAELIDALLLEMINGRDKLRVVLSEIDNHHFSKTLLEKIREVYYVKFAELGIREKDYNAVFTFFTFGSLSILHNWVSNNYRETPEYVLQMIKNLSKAVIEGSLKAEFISVI